MGDLLGDIISGAQQAGGAAVSGAQKVAGAVYDATNPVIGATAGYVIGGVRGAGLGAVIGEEYRQRQMKRAGSKQSQNWLVGAGEGAGKIIDTAAGAIKGGAGLATKGAAMAAAPVIVPAAVAAMGIGAVKSYIEAKKPETDAGVTYRNIAAPVYQSEASKELPSSYMTKKEAEASARAMSGQDILAMWDETPVNRPGYKKVSDLGLDKKTFELIAEGYTPLQAVNERMKTETNPRMKRELDWQRLQLVQNEIETSAGYHNWAKETGRPTAINPYENRGDMALALKQGTKQQARSQIELSNPRVSDLYVDLPGGMGLEDASWEGAKNNFEKPLPDFTKAINQMEYTRNVPGIYGTLRSEGGYDEWNRYAKTNVTPISDSVIKVGNPQRKRIKQFGDELSVEDEFLGLPKGTYGVSNSKGKSKTSKKRQPHYNPLDVKYNTVRGSFQSMRKDNGKIIPQVIKVSKYDELSLLEDLGLSGAKAGKRSTQRKDKGTGKKFYYGI